MKKLTPGQITIQAIGAINILLSLYILGIAYLGYVNHELAEQLASIFLTLIGA